MKIFPLKLERVAVKYPKVVEWQLGNTCNYNCHFCPSHIKDGSLKWIDVEHVERVCQTLIDSSADQQIKFLFTGGEPTLHRDINRILKFISDRGHITALHSNGSRTIRYWKELADLDILNILPLSLHLHQGADLEHFKKIISNFNGTKTVVMIYIMCDINFFNECVSALEELKSFNVLLSMRGVIIGGELDKKYSLEQLEILQKNSLVIGENFNKKNILNNNEINLSFSDGSNKIMKPPDIQSSPGLNRFIGWECDIGKDLLDIKYDLIYGGMCQVGGPIGTIYVGGPIGTIYDSDIKWKLDSVICDNNVCNCATDIMQPKRMIL